MSNLAFYLTRKNKEKIFLTPNYIRKIITESDSPRLDSNVPSEISSIEGDISLFYFFKKIQYSIPSIDIDTLVSEIETTISDSSDLQETFSNILATKYSFFIAILFLFKNGFSNTVKEILSPSETTATRTEKILAALSQMDEETSDSENLVSRLFSRFIQTLVFHPIDHSFFVIINRKSQEETLESRYIHIPGTVLEKGISLGFEPFKYISYKFTTKNENKWPSVSLGSFKKNDSYYSPTINAGKSSYYNKPEGSAIINFYNKFSENYSVPEEYKNNVFRLLFPYSADVYQKWYTDLYKTISNFVSIEGPRNIYKNRLNFSYLNLSDYFSKVKSFNSIREALSAGIAFTFGIEGKNNAEREPDIGKYPVLNKYYDDTAQNHLKKIKPYITITENSSFGFDGCSLYKPSISGGLSAIYSDYENYGESENVSLNSFSDGLINKLKTGSLIDEIENATFLYENEKTLIKEIANSLNDIENFYKIPNKEEIDLLSEKFLIDDNRIVKKLYDSDIYNKFLSVFNLWKNSESLSYSYIISSEYSISEKNEKIEQLKKAFINYIFSNNSYNSSDKLNSCFLSEIINSFFDFLKLSDEQIQSINYENSVSEEFFNLYRTLFYLRESYNLRHIESKFMLGRLGSEYDILYVLLETDPYKKSITTELTTPKTTISPTQSGGSGLGGGGGRGW